jgi:hypothetical protein
MCVACVCASVHHLLPKLSCSSSKMFKTNHKQLHHRVKLPLYRKLDPLGL